MSTTILNYRVLRRNKIFPTTNPEVKVRVILEVLWKSTDGDSRNSQFALIVTGTITEKHNAYPVEWKFPMSYEDVSEIGAAIFTLREGSNSNQTSDQPPIEKELYVDATRWVRVGLIYNDGKFTNCYIEFNKDQRQLRANVDNLSSLENLVGMLRN